MGDALTQARERLAEIDAWLNEVRSVFPSAHPLVAELVSISTDALAEVDRLTALRTAPPQGVATHTSCSPSTPELTCARIVAWIRREADGLLPEMADQRPAEESAHRRGEWDAMTDIADAIERGDWRDAPLPPDPRDARIAALEAEVAGLRAVADTVVTRG